jgi:hypothetical protein
VTACRYWPCAGSKIFGPLFPEAGLVVVGVFHRFFEREVAENRIRQPSASVMVFEEIGELPLFRQ